MSTLDKVRILVIGDSETGKTSLSHLIAHGKPCERTMSTIGCSAQVKLHEFHAGTPSEKSYFVELWEIGGSRGHEAARCLFYNPSDGLILVHDLTNRKSQGNLERWLREVTESRDGGKLRQVVSDFDAELLTGSQVPILVVGTKVDLLKGQEPPPSYIAEECGAEEINLDCTQARCLAPGSSNAVKLSRFFDKVIERSSSVSTPSLSLYTRDGFFAAQERKRTFSPSRTYSKGFHAD